MFNRGVVALGPVVAEIGMVTKRASGTNIVQKNTPWLAYIIGMSLQ